jgi:hypothetical protein
VNARVCTGKTRNTRDELSSLFRQLSFAFFAGSDRLGVSFPISNTITDLKNAFKKIQTHSGLHLKNSKEFIRKKFAERKIKNFNPATRKKISGTRIRGSTSSICQSLHDRSGLFAPN